jgi:uncharacterized membrane protein
MSGWEERAFCGKIEHMVSDKFTMPASPVGIIDSLASGFEIAAAHLQILLLPLGIDLFLWIGPRVSLRPFMPAVEQFWMSLVPYTDSASKNQVLQYVKETHNLAQTSPDRYLPILMPPTLLGGRRASILPFDFKPGVIDAWSGNLGAILIALLSSLLLVEIFYGWIALYVLDEPFSPWRFTRQILSVMGQSILAIGGSLMIVLASMSILMLLFGILGLIGSDALIIGMTWLLFAFTFVFVIPACMMAIFTLHSMFLNRRNMLAAMWDSIRVVQWNMLPTTILLILVTAIYFAMNIIWSLADRGSWLTLAAMGGNAFISTGLIAATFVYYKDRYRHWREIREAVLAELERRRTQQDNNR